MPRNNLADALRLAQQGWKVIPLHTATEGVCDCGKNPCANKPGKHPRIRRWEQRPSDTLQQLAIWWNEWPAANIGVVCGASGLVVVDVDPRNGGIEQMDAWFAEHGEFPAGPKAITGSGGFHFYFAHPKGAQIRTNGDADYIGSRSGVVAGIDVKADGGYVVAPPSVYETGVMYRWADGRGPELRPPAMPHWLREVITSRNRQPGVPGERYALPDAIPVGQRHEELVRWAGFLRQKGASEGIIFNSLMAVNAERCAEPVYQEEIAALAADAARRWQPGESVIYVKAKPETAQRKDVVPYTAAELEGIEMPPPQWAIGGMLPEGMCIVAGPVKFGKSFLILHVALAIAEGDVVLDVDSVREGSVLYVALEDGKRRLQSRIKKMHGAGGWPVRLEIVDMDHRMPRIDEGGLEFVDAWLGQHPDARLVVIDTLQRFRSRQGTKKNAYAQDVDEFEPLQSMAIRHGVAIALIHHLNKALHEDYVDGISGSVGLPGTADTTWYLSRPRGQSGQKEGRLRITGRDVEEQDLSLAFEDFRWRVTGNNDDEMVSDGSPAVRELVEYMQRRPWETYNISEVQEALHKPTYDAAKKLMYKAVTAGAIRKAGRGLFRLPDGGDRNGVPPTPQVPSPFESELGTKGSAAIPFEGVDEGSKGTRDFGSKGSANPTSDEVWEHFRRRQSRPEGEE